ncbi:hypothetical protein EXN66_Car010599 [Channa argus]|uniref:Uncharacterized protein n=1 Tax=Channa argus TaxID=215402 RepID=A0A6G1PXL1_CHAAH|nr:hypothetical protein EXN66_Car010599 [Channa argus]
MFLVVTHWDSCDNTVQLEDRDNFYIHSTSITSTQSRIVITYYFLFDGHFSFSLFPQAGIYTACILPKQLPHIFKSALY